MNIGTGKNITTVLRVFIQLLIWVTVLVVMPLGWKTNWPDVFWIKQAVILILLLSLYYSNSLYFVPNLLLKNKSFSFFLGIIASIIVILVLVQFIEAWLNLPELIHKSFNPNEPYHPKRKFRLDFFLLLLSFLVVGISTSVALINIRNKEREVRQVFEKEKISSELATLKSQINPHFYFNTLNSIYALASIDASLTQKAIHMLSKMMRYVLYESQKPEVMLSQEVAFVDSYIELMKLRLTDKVTVEYKKPVALQNVFIAPMLFMPFIENAFKHGVNPKGKCIVNIEIEQKKEKVFLMVKNEVYKNGGLDLEEDKGIGISNTKRRLELLYPNRHQLEITNENTIHTIVLQLDLISLG